jgi:Imelysin
MKPARLATLLAVAALAPTAVSCGDDDSDSGSVDTTETSAATAADLGAIKSYLTDHTAALAEQTAALKDQGRAYYDLAKAADFDYARMLGENREEVAGILEDAKATYVEANPAYEEMEGIVAGVSSLADYDVIIDAGSSGEDPENAVPFDLELPNGKTLKQPGNFMFLTETSLYGTNDDLAANGGKADIDGNGKVDFGEALPEANIFLATTRDFDKYARELDSEAQSFEPSESDAFSALVIMTPTMSEYFEAWKNSRFVSGSKASEQAFVATSRLSDIADILEGLVFTYDGVKPLVADADPQQAKQTEQSLASLHDFAADLRDKEEDGRQYSAEEADTLGSRAQEQAEAIAGQITQAAARLNIELEEG